MAEKTIWMQRSADARAACKQLTNVCHGTGYDNYQWHDMKTGESLPDDGHMLLRHLYNLRNLADDAARGYVKGHTGAKTLIPEYEEKLAEMLLSIFDIAGAYRIDLGNALSGVIAYEVGYNSALKQWLAAPVVPTC